MTPPYPFRLRISKHEHPKDQSNQTIPKVRYIVYKVVKSVIIFHDVLRA